MHQDKYVPFDNGRSEQRRRKGFDDYFYAGRPKPCNECGKPIDLKPGEVVDIGGGHLLTIADDDEAQTICRACFSKGWIFDPAEVAIAVANDSELSKIVDIASPIQPE